MIAKTKKPVPNRKLNFAKRFIVEKIDNFDETPNKPHINTKERRVPVPPRLGPRPFDGTLDF